MAKLKTLDSELSALLSLKLTQEEACDLSDRGFTVKHPTKMTLLAAALIEKGLKGDLSALREIVSRLSPEERSEGGVILIDDIRN